MEMHGISNRDTHFVPAAQQFMSSSDDNNRAWWNAERLGFTKRLRAFIPDPPSWNGTAKNSVR